MSLGVPKQIPGHRTFKLYSSHVQANALISIYFDHISCFIYFVSLLISSEFLLQYIQACHTFVYTHVRIYLFKINKITLQNFCRVLLTFQNYMCLLYCSFAPYSIHYFACIHTRMDFFYFPLLYTKY